MILDSLFNNKKSETLKKLLDLSSENLKVISNNIANVETPNFTAKKLNFENTLRDAVKNGDVEQISQVVGEVTNNYETPFRNDMNNVNIEKEMLSLEENRMRYDMVATLLKRQLTKWSKIVEGVKA